MTGLLGQRDEHLRTIEESYPDTDVLVRGNQITVTGPQGTVVARLFEEMIALLQRGLPIDSANLGRSIAMVDADESPSEVLSVEVMRSARGNRIRPKSAGQKRYIDAIASNVITFGIGPAGTGKSWLCLLYTSDAADE